MKTKDLRSIRLNCADLGARAGMPPHWMPYAGQLDVDAFEPDEDAPDKGYRKIDGVSWFPVGLAGKTGIAPFYITTTPSGSSLYPPNEKEMQKYSLERYWRVAEVRELEFFGFSDFIRKFDRPKPELVKLDTQGSEQDILASLDDSHWSGLIGLEIEVEFVELYEGQPLFRDTDKFMSERGFKLMDLRTHRTYRVKNERRDGFFPEYFDRADAGTDHSARLVAGDAFYIREYPDDCPADSESIHKLALIFVMYHFFDEAVALAERAHELGRLSKSGMDALIKSVVALAPPPSILQRKSSILRKAKSGVYTVFYNIAKWFGYRLKNRKAKIAGWSMRVWPDQ